MRHVTQGDGGGDGGHACGNGGKSNIRSKVVEMALPAANRE